MFNAEKSSHFFIYCCRVPTKFPDLRYVSCHYGAVTMLNKFNKSATVLRLTHLLLHLQLGSPMQLLISDQVTVYDRNKIRHTLYNID